MRPWAAALAGAALVLAACTSTSESTAEEPTAASDPPSESVTTSAEQPTTETAAAAADSVCRPVTEVGDEPGQQAAVQFELEAAGNPYPVRLYIPGEPTEANDGRHPVVINWHGLGSDGFQQALLTNYEALAEAEGFMVAHPTGAGSGSGSATGGGLATGWELAQFDSPGRDDLAMAGALIDRLVDDYCADPSRVYSTGMSNGGFFTSRLVCELSGRIAAAVAVAGVTHPDDCDPSRPVPFMAIHGTADGVVPFDGGSSQLEGTNAPPELVQFFDQVMPDELAEFAADFGCAPDPEVAEFSDEVTIFEYVSCADDVPVRFVEVSGGGHTWPGAFLGVFMTEALGPTTTDISATSEGWLFMRDYSLDD